MFRPFIKFGITGVCNGLIVSYDVRNWWPIVHVFLPRLCGATADAGWQYSRRHLVSCHHAGSIACHVYSKIMRQVGCLRGGKLAVTPPCHRMVLVQVASGVTAAKLGPSKLRLDRECISHTLWTPHASFYSIFKTK